MALWSDEEPELRAERARSRSSGGAVRLLALVAALLVLALAAGSIYGLAAGTRQKKLAREADSARSSAELKGRASFTDIGTIRAKSADAKSAVVVATIAFPYDAGDVPFAEELSRKAPVLKAAAVALLSSKKASISAPPSRGLSKRPSAMPSTRASPWVR